MNFRVLVQARMSSERLPGKVLRDFRGSSVIGHLINNLLKQVDRSRLTVVTSTHSTDDIIQDYCKQKNIQYFRGDLDDVYLRFVSALKKK